MADITEGLPPFQSQIIDTLLARTRLGEPFWTFSSDPTTTHALRELQTKGFLTIDSGIVERTWRARFSSGVFETLKGESNYSSPLENELDKYKIYYENIKNRLERAGL